MLSVSAPPPIDLDRRSIEAAVERERVVDMYRLSRVPVAVGIGFSAFLCAMLWPYAEASVLLIWLLMRVVASSARLLDAVDFARAMPVGADVARRQRRFIVFMGIDAAVWGAMVVLLRSPPAPEASGLMLAAAIGVAAVGLFSLGSVLRANVVFATLVLGPTIVVNAAAGTPAGLFIAGGLVIYYTLLLFESGRLQRHTLELLRLRYENAGIAEQRQQALLLAERSSTTKSRFLATISHELRTPLNGILGMTQLLERSTLDATQKGRLGVIRQSGAHLLALIDDLLDLSRIEHGRMSIERSACALRRALAEVGDLHAATARDKGLAFRVHVDAGVPEHIVADVARLRQVLHNLIGNAIKFTRRGSIDVQVAVDGAHLRFDVVDTGPGIADHDRERIFEPFEQVVGAGARGTGLGLTISRELARAMGGDLVLDSTPGHGTRFRFTVALEAAPEPPFASTVIDRSRALTPLSGDVLVVDDSPVNALVAQAMLERFGLAVTVAQDGREALQRLAERPWSLVLMDCQMPVLDGIEATRRWREHERERGGEATPIVALTANALASERDRCLASGMQEVLVKPFQLEALHRLVQQHLRPTASTAAG